MVFLFLVSLRCGQQSSENCTYFQSSGTEQGACNAKICAKPGVCQLRLDFPKFAIGMKCLWKYHQFTIYLIYKYLWAMIYFTLSIQANLRFQRFQHLILYKELFYVSFKENIHRKNCFKKSICFLFFSCSSYNSSFDYGTMFDRYFYGNFTRFGNSTGDLRN